MESKQSPSKKKLLSIEEEKLIREVDYLAKPTRRPRKLLPIDLEIFHRNPTNHQGAQKVVVSIKPRPPSIETIYRAEKSRYSRLGSSKSGSRLAIGDHSSFTSNFSEDDSNAVNSIACGTEHQEDKIDTSNVSSVIIQVESSACASQSSRGHSPCRTNVYNDRPRSPEKCYMYTQPNMNLPRLDVKVNDSPTSPNRVDIATLIVTNTSSEESPPPENSTINSLHKRVEDLERKILRQEMVFRALDPGVMLSSSDEEKDVKKTNSGTGRAGCSYIQQYSHVPERSAFQRYAHQAAPLSPSKATTIEKEHNSEQYGRDFTTYDGITARGRRQCASVPCKRDDIPNLAAERVHKIRHKLNPVRDYRLMDTVHYLAQGEFAPRDDGIKLTPSREAVLSDIIYEDVCRTHWPNTRLGRRAAHAERCGTRCELQRLIDSLLRERVAHVERRRRRHYRIVKLNHRHESCRPLGKTGDIIVASHKNRSGSEEAAGSDHNPDRTDKRREERSSRRGPRSHDHLMLPELRSKRQSRHDDGSPGPSHANRSQSSRDPTCCYHHTSAKPECGSGNVQPTYSKNQTQQMQVSELTSGSSFSGCKTKSPRLVVKKDGNRHRQSREEPNLEHYILLPTLVVRTPSNVKRQKKFNELYHKILNVQLNTAQNAVPERADQKPIQNNKKDIGLNFNITLSNSDEERKKE